MSSKLKLVKATIEQESWVFIAAGEQGCGKSEGIKKIWNELNWGVGSFGRHWSVLVPEKEIK